MPDDALYPRSSEFYSVADHIGDQEKTRDAEETKVAKETSIINGVIEVFDESIDHLRSIDSVPNELLTEPDKFMHTVMGNKKAVIVLEGERAKLIDLLDNLKP